MDSYEVEEVKRPQRTKKPMDRVWNILTIFALVALLCFASFFIVVFTNPNSSLNPFPPPTLNPADATATITVTPRFTIIPSWTATGESLQLTDTPVPSDTPVATIQIVGTGTAVPPAVAGVASSYAFELQQGSPAIIDGTQFHSATDCNWMGVAGQATSLNGEALKGLFVQLGGSLPEVGKLDNLVMTGLAPQYGVGGFEFTLSDKPVASSGSLWIQLLDQQNLPLSDKVYFDTSSDCQKNLVIIYFSQIR